MASGTTFQRMKETYIICLQKRRQALIIRIIGTYLYYVAYKIFTLNKRLSLITEKIIQKYQAKFREGLLLTNYLQLNKHLVQDRSTT